jgi:hypothetical protein
MWHFLPHLNARSPGVCCVGFCTVRTLGVNNDVLDFEGLDEEGALECLYQSSTSSPQVTRTLKTHLLHFDLDLNPLRMRLSPDKIRIYQPDF